MNPELDINCDEVSRLISQGLDQSLPPRERSRLRLHFVLCETCRGTRFNPETLAVTWRGKNIGDVLQMEVDEAVDFFAAMPSIGHPLQLLKDVGRRRSAAARRNASSW